MPPLDAFALAARQLARDRAMRPLVRGLVERKLERMASSPLAYLRGSARLFYEALANDRDLARGPAGEGFACGDAHVENFGVFRVEPATRARGRADDVVFDLNDFDEAYHGPLRFDVLRLATSLVVGGRELGVGGPSSIRLARAAIDAHADALFDARKRPDAPPPVERLLENVRSRSARALLDARTKLVRGRRRFLRGERYVELPWSLANEAREGFDRYASTLAATHALEADQLEIADVAFRVAGTGSLGALRVAVLTRGKGGAHDGFVFDMKEEAPTPAASEVVATKPLDPAERVLGAVGACLARPPRMLGTARVGGRSLLVRRLSPQEDKLDLRGLGHEHLATLARYLGSLLGAAHRRGATSLPARAWSTNDREAVLTHALRVAAANEASYLALCHALASRG